MHRTSRSSTRKLFRIHDGQNSTIDWIRDFRKFLNIYYLYAERFSIDGSTEKRKSFRDKNSIIGSFYKFLHRYYLFLDRNEQVFEPTRRGKISHFVARIVTNAFALLLQRLTRKWSGERARRARKAGATPLQRGALTMPLVMRIFWQSAVGTPPEA